MENFKKVRRQNIATKKNKYKTTLLAYSFITPK